MPRPQAGTISLKEIVTTLEADGYQFVNASFDERRWELEGYRNSFAYELWVDRETGRLLSARRGDAAPLPPAGAKPLSHILATVEKSGCTQITSAELEQDHWVVEACRDLAKRELHVDLMTGEILRERAD